MARRKVAQQQAENNNKRAIHKKLARWMWIIAGAEILCVALIFIFISFQGIPSFEELENPEIDYASIVYDDQGKELGRFFAENRVAVPYDSLNPHLVNALIATEDIRYYNHSGIDFRAVGRVIVKTILLGKDNAGGGSTITQQLAKQLFRFRDFSGMNKVEQVLALFYYKFKEWITAVLLEKSYTKEEIIAMYLSKYDFIYSSHGVEAAARTYFGKPQSELNIVESATLIGMLKNSVLYNPIKYPQNCINRRNLVLQRMLDAHYLTEEQVDTLSSKKLDVSGFHRLTNYTGDATYFRAFVAEWTQDLIQKHDIEKPDGTLYNIYTDGLKIFTTINRRMQDHLQDAVREHMEVNQERFLRAWKGKDIWEYKYGPYSVDLKKESLHRLVRQSRRYKLIQAHFLADNISIIQKEFDISLRDYDLERLIKTDKDPEYLDNLEEKNYISEKKADILRSILASDYWPAFKSGWDQMQAQVKEQFATPVEMTVFAYNDKMEKDTVMTPMDSIKYYRMILQVGSIAMNPKNGHIKAWVGGVDHKYFKYDHVNARRQVGSTFKPFLYSAAISVMGFSPCFPVLDIQYTIQPGEGSFDLLEPWKPDNAEGEFSHKKMTLFDGLSHSKNSIAVYLMKQLGSTEPLRDIIDNMGLSKTEKLPNGRYLIPKQPSIALGAADLSVMEMTGAYTTFANNGKYSKPIFVTKIIDKNGKILYQAIPHTQVALNSTVNYVMVEMLRYTAQHHPAARRHHIKSDVGGKTGTTNNQTDGWYMGITPDLVVGTWVGGEDRWIRFRRITYGQGATLARPIFYKFLHDVERDEKLDYDVNERFYKPPGDLGIETDCDLYSHNNSTSPDEKVFEKKEEDQQQGFFR